MLAEIRIYSDGGIGFFNEKNDYHHLDGPALELRNGFKEWYMNGNCHRLDGPAVEYPDGTKFWWINDKEYTEEEFNKLVGGLC